MQRSRVSSSLRRSSQSVRASVSAAVGMANTSRAVRLRRCRVRGHSRRFGPGGEVLRRVDIFGIKVCDDPVDDNLGVKAELNLLG